MDMAEGTIPVLADSNVYIDLLRAGLDPAKELVHRYGELDLVTCGMVKLEVLRAVNHRKSFRKLSSFFEVQQFVPTDNDVWDDAIDLAHALGRIGYTLPAQDLIIAVSAFRTGAAVLTADKHFSFIPNLTVIPSPFRSGD
ncbi:MAG: putative nucleic acid-binding protein [Verrucomicrobiales bacterium]|jgi:predicted nucleic acid-binding protein